MKITFVETLVRRVQIDAVAIEASDQAVLELEDYVERGIGDPAAIVESGSVFKVLKDDDVKLGLRAQNGSLFSKPAKLR